MGQTGHSFEKKI